MKRSDKNSFIKRKQDENEKLENETRAMEQRLRLLKSALYGNPVKDHNANPSENLWASSKTKSYKVSALPNTIDLSKTRIRTLSRPQQAQPKSNGDDAHGRLVQRLIAETKRSSRFSSITPSDSSGVKCGQCESNCAVVSCQECSEDYCAKCFAQFHMKGALRKHHSIPITSMKSWDSKSASSNHVQISKSSSVSDELSSREQSMESAIHDQECQVGRNPMQAEAKIHDSNTERSTISTHVSQESKGISTEPQKSFEIKFTPSLSYAERLMLHLHRKQKPSTDDLNDSDVKISSKEAEESEVYSQSRPHSSHCSTECGEATSSTTIDAGMETVKSMNSSQNWVDQTITPSRDSDTHTDPQNEQDLTLNDFVEEGNIDSVLPTEYYGGTVDFPVPSGISSIEPKLMDKIWSPRVSNQKNVNSAELDTINMIRRQLNLLTGPVEHHSNEFKGDSEQN